jgi:hypothetical protein
MRIAIDFLIGGALALVAGWLLVYFGGRMPPVAWQT